MGDDQAVRLDRLCGAVDLGEFDYLALVADPRSPNALYMGTLAHGLVLVSLDDQN